MKKPASAKPLIRQQKELRSLASSVGDFIRYWGFRRVHGEIWAVVYLSGRDLSGAEITSVLKVSKALVSPALAELEEFGLILCTREGAKTKRYSAAPDVFGVIREILKNREEKLLGLSAANAAKLRSSLKPGDESIRPDRLEDVEKMISAAQFALHFILGEANETGIEHWATAAGA